MTVYGTIATEKAAAAALDAHNARIAERPEMAGQDTTKFVSMWSDSAEEDEKEENERDERTDGLSWQEMEDDDARAVIRSTPTVLALSNAHVIVGGASAPLDVPMLRVQLAHVAAWWPLPMDANGNATWQHPA